jgi:hypothetical protein
LHEDLSPLCSSSFSRSSFSTLHVQLKQITQTQPKYLGLNVRRQKEEDHPNHAANPAALVFWTFAQIPQTAFAVIMETTFLKVFAVLLTRSTVEEHVVVELV